MALKDIPRLLYCTTLRDFKGTRNDEIQKLFLKSIANQSYQHFEMVITLFGEQRVEKVVKQYGFKSFFYFQEPRGYKYSLSYVLLNAVNHAKEMGYERYIVLWSTCDIILDPHLLETILKYNQPNMLGTTHPNLAFRCLEDYYKGENLIREELSEGFDFLFFDNYFLNNESVINSIKKYIFYNWGIFEHFLIALAELHENITMMNFYTIANVIKIYNNRKLTKESNQFLADSHSNNLETFRKFLIHNNIKDKYFSLTYCHLKFTIPVNTLIHYLTFNKSIYKYYMKLMRRRIPLKVKKLLKCINLYKL